MVGKRHDEKLLIKQDGTQITARVGMVDRNGVMFNVTDVGTKYLEFSPLDRIIADIELEKRDLEQELSMTCAALDGEERKVDGLTRLCAEMFECGIFDREQRVLLMNRYYKFRGKVE